MNNKYTSKELNIMKSTLYDGMPVDELHSLLFPRKKTAIVKKVQYFGYGVKTIDGIQYFYSGLKSRTRRTKAEIGEVSSEKVTIIGESRVAGTTQESISERTTENVSDGIIADSSERNRGETLKLIDEEMSQLFSNIKFDCIESITICFKNRFTSDTKALS